jgi:uncharacterized oxidoreductase
MNHRQVHIAPAELRAFAARLFVATGVPSEEAAAVAESLVESNLCGHDSHGVMRVVDYVDQLRIGELVAGAELWTLSETQSMLAADAGFGFGQVQCRRLIERLRPKAAAQGVACGTLVRCGHVGRLGEWVERVARDGLAGLIAVNDNGVLQCVAPPGGTQPRISTNPLAIGVPTGGEPLVLDISTSVVANGKVRLALLAGRQCPEGWLLDSEGNPTTDPATRFADPPGSILPLGGEQAYKGFGLGLLLDVLVGGLSGGSCPPALATAKNSNNVLLAVWDPRRFAGNEHFVEQARELVRYVRDTRRAAGIDAIRLPGDRAAATREARAAGIPLDQGTWNGLTKLADTMSVAVPAVVNA